MYRNTIKNHALSIATAILSLWLLLIISAPVFVQSGYRILQLIGTGIYFFVDPVCHQLPDRSLFLGSLPFPVCTRCLFIYSGGLIILLIAHFTKKFHRWNGFVYIIMGLIIIAELFMEKLMGIQSYTELRILSGLLMGAVITRFALESITLIGEKKNNV
jgi:uncharacterized membrane protein